MLGDNILSMCKSILENLGLTKSETSVYLALLEIGTNKVGEIIKETNLTPSVIHNALNNLVEKGLVTYIIKRNIKYYTPANPKLLINIIEEKKRDVESILPELMEKQKVIETEKAEIFEGITGIKALFWTMLERKDLDNNLLFFGGEYDVPKHLEIDKFYTTINKKFKEEGIKTKGVYEEKLRGKVDTNNLLDLRYTGISVPLDLNIFEDSVAIISWSEKPVGTLIVSQQIADKFRLMWKDIWKKSKQ